MSTITTQDGTEIYYKDWGSGLVVTFSHGWPLSPDAWDGQLLLGGSHAASHSSSVHPLGTNHSSAASRFATSAQSGYS